MFHDVPFIGRFVATVICLNIVNVLLCVQTEIIGMITGSNEGFFNMLGDIFCNAIVITLVSAAACADW